jgi:hypothetical protein
MEKLLLKHMWRIAIFFWLIVITSWVLQYINLPVWWFIQNLFWITEIKKTISTQYMFTTIWTIFVFWYWYKKYERDKELELLNQIKSYNLESFDEIYRIYYLKEKWYIPISLWELIDLKISDNILIKLKNGNSNFKLPLSIIKDQFWYKKYIINKIKESKNEIIRNNNETKIQDLIKYIDSIINWIENLH